MTREAEPLGGGKGEMVLRPLEEGDVPLVALWLNRDPLREWFGDPEDWLSEIREREGRFSFLHHFVALLGEDPVGFCQYYRCADADEEVYRSFPREGTYSVDYGLGDAACLGKGLGRELVRCLSERVLSLPDARRIVVAPDRENEASRRTLLRCGFVLDEERGVFVKERD